MTARALTLALAMSLAVASGCRAKSSSDPAPTAGATTSTSEASFNVDGMHCATCPLTVKTAAEGVPGVKSAKVSMADKRATVTYDATKTNPQAIAAAITESGYPATSDVAKPPSSK